MYADSDEVRELKQKVERRLLENPGDYVMMLLPAKSFLGDDIANSRRLVYKDRWGEVSINSSIGVVVVTNDCDSTERAFLRDECIKTGRVFVNLNVVGIGPFKKMIKPFMKGWRPPKVSAPPEPVSTNDVQVPATSETQDLETAPVWAESVQAPVVTPALREIPLDKAGKVKKGELSALVEMEIAEHGIFECRTPEYRAAIDRLEAEAKEQRFGERTTRASIMNAYYRCRQAAQQAASTAGAVQAAQEIPPVATTPETPPSPAGRRSRSDGLHSLITREVESYGFSFGRKDSAAFTAAIDRLVKQGAAAGVTRNRAAIKRAYERRRELWSKAGGVETTPPVPAPTPAPTEEPAPVPALEVKSPAAEVVSDSSQEDLGALLANGIDNFDVAKGLYDEAHRSLKTVVSDAIFKIISRDAGKAASLREAASQIEVLKRTVSERDDRIAELEGATAKAAEQIESLKAAVSHLDNEIRKGQRLVDQAVRFVEVERENKIYKGIEGMFPQLRAMRENAEAMNRSLSQS